MDVFYHETRPGAFSGLSPAFGGGRRGVLRRSGADLSFLRPVGARLVLVGNFPPPALVTHRKTVSLGINSWIRRASARAWGSGSLVL